MKWQIKKCKKCGRYTLKEKCPICGGGTSSPHPPKFSLQDKYLELKILGKEKAEGNEDDS